MNTKTPTPPLVLVFAASDPTGGAGIQADMLTLASLGCHPLVGGDRDDRAGHGRRRECAPVDAELGRTTRREPCSKTCRSPPSSSACWAVSRTSSAIAEIVSDYPDIPLVFDPVLASGRGDELVGEEMISAMRELLLPQTTILTPNAPEARRLARTMNDDESEPAIDRVRASPDRHGLRSTCWSPARTKTRRR